MATTTAPTNSERWVKRLTDTVGYATLLASTILAVIANAKGGEELIGTLLVAGLGALWVFGLYTRAPEPRAAHRLRMAVFFVGLLVFASALMLRDPRFFIFMISGFFYASVLRPLPLAILGVFATTFLINTLLAGIPTSADGWTFYLSIIIIQTIVIGGGTVAGERITEQNQERKEALARLETALEENAGLHRQLVAQARQAGVLDERQRMAREIHDTIAHGLTGVVTQLEAAKAAADRPSERDRHIENAASLARESLREARRSLEAARPEVLESSSLPDAMASVARSWSALNDVPVEVTTTGQAILLNPEIESALLRTAQEALENVARHANATRVAVTLSFMGDVVTLDVRDDGVGFELSEGRARTSNGFGLTAMRQRISRVAGTLAIESEPGGGTAVSARVPAIGVQAP
jgi:signal transduction histidine kinase